MFDRSQLNLKVSSHIFKQRGDKPSRYDQAKLLFRKLSTPWTDDEIDKILSVDSVISSQLDTSPAPAPSTAVSAMTQRILNISPDSENSGQGETEKESTSFSLMTQRILDMTLSPSNISRFAVAMAIELPLYNSIPDFQEYRRRFIELALSNPCDFKALCAINIMWYTYVFDCITNSRTAPATSTSAVSFPYDSSRDMFQVENKFFNEMKDETNAPNGLCDWSKNFIPNVGYEQIDVGCNTIPENSEGCESHGPRKEWYAVWDSTNKRVLHGSDTTREANVIDALGVCKEWGNSKKYNNGFFYQQHNNGHMICGYYKQGLTSEEIDTASTHGHNMGTVCNVRTQLKASVSRGPHAGSGSDFTVSEIAFEPFIRLCLQYVLLEDKNGVYQKIRDMTPEDDKFNCVFQTSGNFDPILCMYQAVNCSNLTLSPNEKVNTETGCKIFYKEPNKVKNAQKKIID